MTRHTISLLAFLMLLFPAPILFGNEHQTVEILAKDRPEAWAMKLVGSELLPTSLGIPSQSTPWSVDLGVEVGWLPSLDAEQRMIGFNGTKQENVNRTPLFARPRVQLGLPADFSLTLGLIPPVRIGGIRPTVVAVALGRPLLDRGRWRLAGRVYGQRGTLEGDITCDRDTVEAGDDPVRNPFGCQAPSEDKMTIRSAGIELGGAFRATDTLEPYAAVAWNYFDTDFEVNAVYSGFVDQSLLLASGPTVSMTTGVAYNLDRRIRLTGEVLFTPLDVQRGGIRVGDDLWTIRASLSYRLR